EAPRHLEETLTRLAGLPSSIAFSNIALNNPGDLGSSLNAFSSETVSAGAGAAVEEETDETQVVDSQVGDDSTQAADSVQENDPEAGNPVFVPSAPPPRPWGAYQLVLLDVRDAEARTVVGGLILEADPSQTSSLEPEFLRSVARVLLDRRVQNTAFSSF